MATSTIPIGNPAGVNQGNPALKGNTSLIGATAPSANPIPGGSAPSSSNPYIFSGGGTPGGTTGSAIPSTSPALQAGAYPSAIPQAVVGGDPTQQALLQKQLVDIYGKGVGGQEAAMFSGMGGTESDIYKQLQAGMAPTFAAQKADLMQTMGAAGVSPNSTVESLGLSNLLGQQGATMASENARLMMQNQQNQLGLLGGAQQAAEEEVASSGWDVFGQVMNTLGQVGGEVLGAASGAGGFGSLFGMGKKAAAGAIPTGIAPGGLNPNLGVL